MAPGTLTLAIAGFETFTVGASVVDFGLLAKKPAPTPRAHGLQLAPALTMAQERSHGRVPLLGIVGTF